MGGPGPTDLGHTQRSSDLLLIKAGMWMWQVARVSVCEENPTFLGVSLFHLNGRGYLLIVFIS